MFRLRMSVLPTALLAEETRSHPPPLQQTFGLCHRVIFRSLLVFILLDIFFSYSSVLPLAQRTLKCMFILQHGYSNSIRTFTFNILFRSTELHIRFNSKQKGEYCFYFYFLVYRFNIPFILPRVHSQLGSTYHVY